MSTIYYPANRRPAPRPAQSAPSLLERILLAILAGILIFGLAVVGTLTITRLWYGGRIFPGVSVNGVDVGGLNPREAAALLAKRIDYPQRGQIVLRDGERLWNSTPGELGLYFDADATAQAAFEVGRKGAAAGQVKAQLEAAAVGINLAPQMLLDQRTAFNYISSLARQVDAASVEASLRLNGAEVQVSAGKAGRYLDVNAALTLVTVQAQTLTDGVLDLPIQESAPAILDASAEAELARRILSAPLKLSVPGGGAGPWELTVDQLAQMLAIEIAETEAGPRYQVGLRQQLLVAYLADVAPKVLRYPVNARFIFNDDTRQLDLLEPAVIGRQLDVEGSLHLINEQLRDGKHEIELAINTSDPQVTDSATGADLGITELVQSTTSYFRGSDNQRVQNIQAASSRFHGLLVAPGETFSMASAIGDITLDNGYAEALIIVGGQTIKGVGGGVCQVSTTLFRTAFFAGFPIVERYAHAYRVGYYEQTWNGYDASLAGLDATVFVPLVDFKFINDTPYWLLMETYVEGYSLTWKFYSTSDGRSVSWVSSGPTNRKDPPDPIYRENSDLQKGQIKQVDWAAEGADVSVDRTVTRNGSVYFSDEFNTHYQAWANAYEYGPGTELPEESRNGDG